MPSALEDREAIRELLAAYCFALDECRFEAFGALFAEDAEWGPKRIPQKARGPREIAELARSIVPVAGEGPKRRHLTTNIVIALEGDRARVKSNFLMVRESEGGPLLAIAGTYEDEVVRTQAGWRFRHREIHNDIAGELGLKR
ncbi:nuclear transport factor 2 family protein [Siccirubricoccus sp. KC 17139]|uniref:Nuclear transport factor 2 family protein n=1 Tax=Siccirubricoccus soli TaxID=2899147 RepID=A0ABT1D484_9PROT|nr:nuclear transport factor 2 family protein [Siccirubricoccus soli]MCO6416738.1 nuclear transport factor 2 family protein [Siccirubricoccus soli]MCP2682873.1 nuclear transport factor 2 family protein [Siccirubricoccus soli]